MYLLAVLTTLLAIGVTRVLWPVFAGTPFVPMFAAVALTTHFGSGAAGLVALGLNALGAFAAFPAASPLEPRAVIVFLVVGLLANRILVSRNRIERALRTRDAELQAVWAHAALGAALLDRQGHIARLNPALERLLGAPAASYTGQPFSASIHPDEVSAERGRFATLVAGDESFYQGEQRCQRADGTTFWARITVSAIRAPDGRPTGALAIVDDISARRQAELELRASEERLRRAQKMEAIGQLVAGVAHNFNNLLTVTLGRTELLLARHGADDADHGDLEEIHKATTRGATLTRQLLAFGRRHRARPARVDLNQTLGELRAMLTRVIREDIQLAVYVGSTPAIALLDPHDLEQVIVNLVINARDALPSGGRIDIDVTSCRPGDIQGALDVSEPSAEYLRLRVRDTGLGMTSEVQAHLFEPFFTTKEVGQGTGLGLAFVHGVVRSARGFVTVDSAPAQGTTVALFLPRLIDPPPEATAETRVPSPIPVTTTATILVVEDEESVRTTTVRLLERVGYHVWAAATPHEACALFESHGADVDLLLTDVVMPGMHGPVLAERLMARRPDLRVLFVSGHSDVVSPGAADTTKVAFLGKPFDGARLVMAVESLLNDRVS